MYDKEKEKLSVACKILSFLGVAHDDRGHVSCRVSDDRMLIPGHVHQEGRGLRDIKKEDIVLTDFEGNVIDGALKEPMGEFYAYSEIYRKRHDIKSMAHIHPLYANVLVSVGIPIRPVSMEGLRYLNGVSVLEAFPLYIGDPAMGKRVTTALGKSNIVIHKYHGAFVTGKSIEDVTITCIALEQGSYAQRLMHSVGRPKPLPLKMIQKPSSIDSPHAFYHDIQLQKTFQYYSMMCNKESKSA